MWGIWIETCSDGVPTVVGRSAAGTRRDNNGVPALHPVLLAVLTE
jgi:hypothetical protein